jgi:hypothetical protein
VGWTRLLAGRFSDPLVCREVLFGLGIGLLLWIAVEAPRLFLTQHGVDAAEQVRPDTLLGPAHYIFELLTVLQNSAMLSLIVLMILLLLKIVLRSYWLAVTAFMAFQIGLPLLGVSLTDEHYWLHVYRIVASAVVVLVVLMRGGLVMLMAVQFVALLMMWYPLTLDLSKFYAGASVTAMLAIIGLAAFATYNTMRPRLSAPFASGSLPTPA